MGSIYSFPTLSGPEGTMTEEGIKVLANPW